MIPIPFALSPLWTGVIWAVGLILLLLIALYVYGFFTTQRLREEAETLARELEFNLDFPEEDDDAIWRMKGVRNSRPAAIELARDRERGRLVRFRIQLRTSDEKRAVLRDTLAELESAELFRLTDEGWLELSLPMTSLSAEEGQTRLAELSRMADDMDATLSGETEAAGEREG